jgi:hypothetical protein
MRVQSLLMLGVLAAAGLAAQGTRFAPMSLKGDPSVQASVYNGPRTQVSMWIWSDKYTYQPGETLTLKWTVKTNGDLYPYTVFVYRQNNQSGAKTYYPNGTSAPTDIHGNTPDQGFEPAPLSDVTKGVVMGSGGMFPALSIPNELGMHTLVVQLRDYTGTRPLKTAYMKIGVVNNVTTLTSNITSDVTLTNDTAWHLKGLIFVKSGATLTIQPGTFIFGESNPASALIITQTGQIYAKGTKSRPIVMTSAQPFGQRTRGDWAGFIMMGKAPINVPANTSGNNNAAGTFYVEGLNTTPDGLFGGDDPNYNCGTLEYVRVEYSGFILGPGNEINSYTFAGCGKGTVADHLQAIFGLDDAFEWFGGTMDAKYLVGGLGRDDYTDFQLGWTGRLQFGLMYQSPDYPGNRGIEGDNSEYDSAATPYSHPTFYNITYVGTGQPGFDESDSPGIYLRRGAQGSFNNLVVTNFYSPCMEIFPDQDKSTQAQANAGQLTMNGVLCYNNNLGAMGANTLAGQVTDAFSQSFAQGQIGNGAGKNFVVADPLLTRPFEYSDPDFSARFSSPIFRTGWVQPPDDGFFDQSAQFVGGIGDYDWTEEWTNFLVDDDIR